jgi:membrane protein DedA with SNARE-associated domain
MGTDALLAWFGQHLYLALLTGIALETAGLPVPGEILLLAAGYMVGRGDAALSLVVAAAFLAALVGDSVWYAAGRRGGQRLLAFYCRASLGSGQCVRRTQAYFDRFGPATVTLARLLPGIRAMTMPLAGSSRMPWPRFLAYDGVGVFLWVLTYALLGVMFSHRWPGLETAVRAYQGNVLILLALIVLATLGLRLRRRRQHGPGSLAPEAPGRIAPAAQERELSSP